MFSTGFAAVVVVFITGLFTFSLAKVSERVAKEKDFHIMITTYLHVMKNIGLALIAISVLMLIATLSGEQG